MPGPRPAIALGLRSGSTDILGTEGSFKGNYRVPLKGGIYGSFMGFVWTDIENI